MSAPAKDDTHAERVSREDAEVPVLAAFAHELKGPLQVLTNLLHLIETDCGNASTSKWVAQAQEQVDRIKQITAGLLETTRRRSSETEVELAFILENSLESFQEKIEFKKITVEKRYDCRGIIKSAPVEIRQVSDNILANALEAAPFGGNIIVHLLESRDWKEPSRRGCRFLIFDNGPGISREFCDKIFDPFFTTKEQKGTGIGLWVVQKILRKHGGLIHFRSCLQGPKRGMVFSIFLRSVAPQAI